MRGTERVKSPDQLCHCKATDSICPLSTNNNNILYSSQREIKAVVRSYTLTHKEELNYTYLNKSHETQSRALLDIHPLSLSLRTLKDWSNANT